MHSRVNVAALVGSAVPAQLRLLGVHVCWAVLVDGETVAPAFEQREQAEACQRHWQARLGTVTSLLSVD